MIATDDAITTTQDCGAAQAAPQTFAQLYRAATDAAGGVCPIEAGVICKLADNECAHGRLPGDRTPACGCWPGEIFTNPTTTEEPMATTTNGAGDREQLARQRVEEMHAYYQTGQSLDAVGERFGVTGSYVGQLFAKYNLAVRPRGTRITPTITERAKAASDEMQAKVDAVVKAARERGEAGAQPRPVTVRTVEDAPAPEPPAPAPAVEEPSKPATAVVSFVDSLIAQIDDEIARLQRAREALRDAA